MILFLIDFRYIKQKKVHQGVTTEPILENAQKKLINTKLKFLFDILLTN